MVKFPLTQSSWLKRQPFPSPPPLPPPPHKRAVRGRSSEAKLIPRSPLSPLVQILVAAGLGARVAAQRCDHPAVATGRSFFLGRKHRVPLSRDVAPWLFLGCWPEPAPLPHPSDISGLSRSHALSRAQLMPACPAPALRLSGPVSHPCLFPGPQTLLGGAGGCGEPTPTAPFPSLNNGDSECRLALSPRGSRMSHAHPEAPLLCPQWSLGFAARSRAGSLAPGTPAPVVPIGMNLLAFAWSALSPVPTSSPWTLIPACKVRGGAGTLRGPGNRGLGLHALGQSGLCTWALSELLHGGGPVPGAAVSLGLSPDTALGPGRGSIGPQQTVSVPSCPLHPCFLSECYQGAPGACSLHSAFTRPFTHWRDPMTPGGFACAGGPACGKAEVTERPAPGPTGCCEARMWTPLVVLFILLPSVSGGLAPWGDLGQLPGGGVAKLDLSFLPLPFVPKGLLRRCPPPPLAFVSSVPLPRRHPTPLLHCSPGAASLGWKAPH